MQSTCGKPRDLSEVKLLPWFEVRSILVRQIEEPLGLRRSAGKYLSYFLFRVTRLEFSFASKTSSNPKFRFPNCILKRLVTSFYYVSKATRTSQNLRTNRGHFPHCHFDHRVSPCIKRSGLRNQSSDPKRNEGGDISGHHSSSQSTGSCLWSWDCRISRS